MRETWRNLLYVLLMGCLPIAFWYALWPHRRRLKKPKSPPIISTDG